MASRLLPGDGTGAPERARSREIIRRLARAYGAGHPARPSPVRLFPARRDPLDELIFTVLSQSTSDTNRDRAWDGLRSRFPTWEAAAHTRTPALARAIAPGGLANTKAPRIKAILREIERREGGLSLARLGGLTDSEVREYLCSLPGVGPKTAACVLAFSLGRPALPVDTHVHRAARRLGLVAPRASAERTEEALEMLVPPAGRVEAHLNLIAHGRTVCRAPQPLCRECPLLDLCPSAPGFLGDGGNPGTGGNSHAAPPVQLTQGTRRERADRRRES
ncbi:MAG: endonuclease III [Acidobacteria bacterium]|nr:endonuclease III [Acidobacteriota bacterium]